LTDRRGRGYPRGPRDNEGRRASPQAKPSRGAAARRTQKTIHWQEADVDPGAHLCPSCELQRTRFPFPQGVVASGSSIAVPISLSPWRPHPVSTVSDCKSWGQQIRDAARIASVAMTIARSHRAPSANAGASRTVFHANRSWLGDRGHHIQSRPERRDPMSTCARTRWPGRPSRTVMRTSGRSVRQDLQPGAAQRTLPPDRPSDHAFVRQQRCIRPCFARPPNNVPRGCGSTVAVVDARPPHAESDLRHIGEVRLAVVHDCDAVPSRRSTRTAVHVYPVPTQVGRRRLSLDIQMVSRDLSSCRIPPCRDRELEIDTLGAGVNRGRASGRTVVSNILGRRMSDELEADRALFFFVSTTTGFAIVESTGAPFYRRELTRRRLPHVVAVGGTTLFQATSSGERNGARDRVGTRAASGCSALESEAGVQTDAGCDDSNRR